MNTTEQSQRCTSHPGRDRDDDTGKMGELLDARPQLVPAWLQAGDAVFYRCLSCGTIREAAGGGRLQTCPCGQRVRLVWTVAESGADST